MIKIYAKTGKKNYKEIKLINKLTAEFEKRLSKDPNFTFETAQDYSELIKLHSEHCIEDVNFTEIEPTKNMENLQEPKEPVQPQEPAKTFNTTEVEDQSFVDPMNREEPIVRDYVLNDEQPNETKGFKSTGKTVFEEPISFQEAFEMPEGDDTTENIQKQFAQPEPKQGSQNQPNNAQPNAKTNPVNPSFNDMDNGKKKRSTKKFAKYIVETVCMLTEKGFVWYANKDINDAKLAEYELKGDINLDLLVTLDTGQTATVKQFFQQQCFKAEQLAVISADEKSDLIDSLAEVMLEKGIAPTPSQELIMISLKILGGQAVALFALTSQTNSLLMQLKSMNEPIEEQPTQPQAQQQSYKEPIKQKEPVDYFEEIKPAEPTKMPEPEIASVIETEHGTIIDKPTETKE